MTAAAKGVVPAKEIVRQLDDDLRACTTVLDCVLLALREITCTSEPIREAWNGADAGANSVQITRFRLRMHKIRAVAERIEEPARAHELGLAFEQFEQGALKFLEARERGYRAVRVASAGGSLLSRPQLPDPCEIERASQEFWQQSALRLIAMAYVRQIMHPAERPPAAGTGKTQKQLREATKRHGSKVISQTLFRELVKQSGVRKSRTGEKGREFDAYEIAALIRAVLESKTQERDWIAKAWKPFAAGTDELSGSEARGNRAKIADKSTRKARGKHASTRKARVAPR